MIKIFTTSCATCGIKGIYVSRIKAHNEVEVRNTRVHKEFLPQHLEYQLQAGMGDVPVDIVVDGDRITLLSEYK